MQLIDFIQKYWTQILFFGTLLISLVAFMKAMIEGVKCSLRNDILTIYDNCKEQKQITRFQLEAVEISYSLYKRLRGNSFVETIVNRMRNFEVID